MKKKIVIVSYAAFPSVAPRSQRTTELAKGFAKQGDDVTLYIMKGEYDYSNFEKETNVKVKSLGKTRLIKFTYESGTHYSLLTKALQKVIGNAFEFPGIEIISNVYDVLKSEDNIDLLISVAVPYPIHWGVALYRQRHPGRLINTTWVADCGDPYMGNPFHKKPFYFKYIEKWFCDKADFLTVPIEEARRAYYPEFRDKIEVIPQGFDFDELDLDGFYVRNAVPTFIYAGVFYNKLRDPRPFLDYLVTLPVDFRFIVYTKSRGMIEEYKNTLKEKLIIHDYISRRDLLVEMSKADFLLNIENPSEAQSPSKLIDYALSMRPILSISTANGIDTKNISRFLRGDYSGALRIKDIEKYNIKNVVKSFKQLLKK